MYVCMCVCVLGHKLCRSQLLADRWLTVMGSLFLYVITME